MLKNQKLAVVLIEKEGIGIYFGLQLKKLLFSQKEIEGNITITKIKNTVESEANNRFIKILIYLLI